jgi:hypothetical protein
MIRFWFKFEPSSRCALNLGCGVTACDYDDAVALLLLQETVFKDGTLPRILEVTANVDISTLDQRHVVPNMEVPTARGVWFPKGYSTASGWRAAPWQR